MSGLRYAGCFEHSNKFLVFAKVRGILDQLNEYYVMRHCGPWRLTGYVTVTECNLKCNCCTVNISDCFILFVGFVVVSFRIVVMAHRRSNWFDIYAELKKNHDEAYSMIEKAIELEQEGKQNEVC